MPLSVAVTNAIAKVDELVTLVKGQFTKWDNQVKGKVAELENWRNNYKYNESLTMPLNYNSFLEDLGNGRLDRWGILGTVQIESVHPYSKGFEGPYTELKPSTAVNHPSDATPEHPYWFGRYYAGPRTSRGGLSGGWGGTTGHILKITKPAGSQHNYNNAAVFSLLEEFKRSKFRFRGFVYIAKGPKYFHLRHLDDGGQINVPTLNEWHFIDVVVNGSNITTSSMRISLDSADECEVYIAMMNIHAITAEGNGSSLINRRTK